MDYDDKAGLQICVTGHLRHLMTEPESDRLWAEFARYKREFRKEFLEETRAESAGGPRPERRDLTPSLGYAEFVEEAVSRLLRDNPTVVINRCPKCRSVLRTPEAKLCLWCGHSQYGAAS